MDWIRNDTMIVHLAAICQEGRAHLIEALLSEGLRFHEHSGDANLLDALRAHPPDVLMLGCHRSPHSASRLCQSIKQDPQLERISVIAVLCSDSNWDEAHRLLDAGGDGVLEVKGDPSQLSVRLRQILRSAETSHLLHRKIDALQSTTQKLSASAQTFIKAFRNNPTAMCLTRLDDGIIFEANAAFLRLFGYEREEVIGARSIELNLFEDISQRQAIFQELRERGVVSEREVRMRNRHGEARLGMFFVEPLELGGRDILLTVINDITELKNARDALERSNEKIAIDSSGLGVWDWRVQDGKVTINSGWAAMLGLEDQLAGEVSYDLWASLCHPDDLPHLLEQLQLHLDGKSPSYAAEVRMRHRNGHWVWVQTLGKITVRTDDGLPLRMAGTHTDISLRKEAELAAVAANAYNRGLIEANLDPLVTIGVDGKIQDVNKATETITGQDRHALIGTDFSDYFTEPESAREGYRKVFQNGFVRDYPLVLKHLNGHSTPVLYNATVYRDRDGNVAGVFAAARDISHQLETEFRLHSMSQALEEGPSSVYITDTEGNIEYVNPAFTNMCGYTIDDVRGVSARILRSDYHDEEEYLRIWELLRQGTSWKGELCRRRKDGSDYWVSVLFAPVRDYNGKVARYVAISEDITAKRHSEELLRQAKEFAEQASRAKSVFLANMSHEIRTPLNAVIGYAQWLRGREEIQGEARKRLEIISQSGNHLLELINSLLEASKLEAGRVSLNESWFSPADLLNSLAGMFTLDFQHRGLDFITEFDASMPSELYSDAVKIRQIIINLLGNAAKFTKAGSVRFTSSFQTKDGQPCWALQVEDTGPGITTQEMARLFHRFEQTQAGKALQSGSGLGLAISREYARLMGGDLTVQSQAGHGSKFTLWLPIQPKQKPESARIAPAGHGDALREAHSEPPTAALVPEQLPPLLAEQMLNALRLGKSQDLMKILLEMDQVSPSCSQTLRAMAEHYEYDQMHQWITKNLAKSGSPLP